MKTTITIKGTHCTACKTLLEDVCKDVPGIISCSVDFKTGQTDLEHTDALSWPQLKTEIESLGQYTVEVPVTL